MTELPNVTINAWLAAVMANPDTRINQPRGTNRPFTRGTASVGRGAADASTFGITITAMTATAIAPLR